MKTNPQNGMDGAAVALRGAASAARARLLREAGLPVRPRFITLNVTDRCNARCAMCEIHTRLREPGQELDLGDIRRVFADPVMRRLEALRITGGEPFLRNDIADIFRTVQRHTPVAIIHVTTNGLLPGRVEEFARTVLPSRAALHLQVSLDALDGRHDGMRGVTGALDRARETLDRLAALKQNFQFHFGINQTVLAGAMDQIEPINRLARELGAGHSIILGARHHEGKDMTRSAMNGQPLPFLTQEPMSAEQVREFYRIVEQVKGRAAPWDPRAGALSARLREVSEAYLNQGGRNRLLHGRNRPAPPCMALFAHARILADGDVVSCSVMADQPIGNVKEQSFGAIWRSSRARAVRRRTLRCPGCWIECDIQPSIFYSGDIIPWAAGHYLRNIPRHL